MKIFKIILSKTILILLSLVIQFALFFSFTLKFNEYSLAVQIIGSVFGFFVFTHMINKKESPEFKLPWLFLLIVLPYFATLLYVMFANPKLTKRQAKNIKATHEDMRKFTDVVDKKEQVKNFLGESNDIENYLRNTSRTFGFIDSKATYFKSGEEFFSDLIIELEKAEKFIFMEYFIISHGTMWKCILDILTEKAQNGVEVRIIYDDVGTLGKLTSGYYKKLRKLNIKCVKANPFRPIISAIYNNRDHRKLTIIDGKIGYTGGVNIGDEYINIEKRLGYWKDSAVKIEGNAVINLTEMFLTFYDGLAKTKSEYGKYLLTSNLNFSGDGYVHPFGDGPKPYYKEQIGENNFINLINKAKKYVYITTPYLIIDHNLTMALKNAVYRGIDVSIMLPHVPDKKIIFNVSRSHYEYLLDCGVKIYEFLPGFLHSKTMLVDGETAFVGTINLDYRSLVHHFECGVVLHRCDCVKDIRLDLEDIMSKSIMITKDNFHMSTFKRLINSILALFFPML